MPQTAISIIGRALQASKTGSISNTLGTPSGYTLQALQFLNAILGDLCEEYDYALARGVANFNFNTNQTTIAGGAAIISGPNRLPLDYLRTSGSSGSEGAQKSVIWYINGVPEIMTPYDLAEFDIQVQQAGIQSYPWMWATDMSVATIAAATQGNLTSDSLTVGSIANTVGIVSGMSVAGNGIVPGSTMTISGSIGTLSAAATATASQASLIFGNPPIGYVYPPPSGSFPVQMRYQRRMPDLTQAQVTAGVFPWFPNDGYLVKELSARLMTLSDDSRESQFHRDAMDILAAYHRNKDDDANRAQTVQLDKRRFGPAFSNLRNTKQVGWMVLLGCWLGGLLPLAGC